MEKLKSAVPEALKQEIWNSTPTDLPSTCSSLLHFFYHLPQFHQMVTDLTDPSMALCCKDSNAALDAKLKGNQCFSKGDYSNALLFYSQALRLAPVDMDDVEKNLVALLYVNRASTLQKMGLLLECLRDCSRALRVSPHYAKAWFQRGKANISMGMLEDAIRDLNISLKAENSLSGKRQIEAELKIALDKFKGMGSSGKKTNQNQSEVPDEPGQVKLQCLITKDKGRGMFCVDEVSEASVVHKEDPYAAIILKKCRETHCHFCFNELPADAISCASCSITLYCSDQCQLQACGEQFDMSSKSSNGLEGLADDLKNYISDVVLAGTSTLDSGDTAEHRHECLGFHWPMILPSEVVLAGRILAKATKQKTRGVVGSNILGILDLSHNYHQLPPESKLEMHIYSIILLHCLQHFYTTELPISGIMISKLVILLSQIQVNSMAVVRMQAPKVKGPLYELGNTLTSSLEQVKVGQAVYVAGSLFNHSCQPNTHVYFLSRTLYAQSTEYIIAGSELELSYGPQVGQWDCKDRQQLLEDGYSFTCHCTGCSELNVPDLVINAYRCTKPNCLGVILDSTVARFEKQKLKLQVDAPTDSSGLHKQVEKIKDDNISEVACRVFESDYKLEPQHCLACDSYRDLEASCAATSQAESRFKRLQDAIASNEIPTDILQDALRCRDLLRTILHPYNRRIAEVEDILAQAFCLVGRLQAALDHCRTSIQILEKLYDPNHIAIGNELVKLASLQMLMGNSAVPNSLNRIAAIFSRYYGSHADYIYPYLRNLIASQDVEERPAFYSVEGTENEDV